MFGLHFHNFVPGSVRAQDNVIYYPLLSQLTLSSWPCFPLRLAPASVTFRLVVSLRGYVAECRFTFLTVFFLKCLFLFIPVCLPFCLSTYLSASLFLCVPGHLLFFLVRFIYWLFVYVYLPASVYTCDSLLIVHLAVSLYLFVFCTCFLLYIS